MRLKASYACQSPPDEDVKAALEAIGFRICSKSEDAAQLDQGLVEFWHEHESSINGYSELSDHIVTFQEFVRLLLLSDAPQGFFSSHRSNHRSDLQ